ncbi:MAG: NAD-dependent epimerase/dehydratase family protein [Burkholderiales bacterium]
MLPDYFPLIEASGARRVVALSSTSRFTKVGSGDTAENAIAAKLIDAEARVQAWAKRRGIEWVVLRPTLIYGQGRDKNISEMARFIRRFGFFPLLGSAQGLRQPIHAEDVAAACVAALQAPGAANRAYNLSGGESLAYREMVARVFAALGRSARLVTPEFDTKARKWLICIGCKFKLPLQQAELGVPEFDTKARKWLICIGCKFKLPLQQAELGVG